VTQCGLVGDYERFGETYCFSIQDRLDTKPTLHQPFEVEEREFGRIEKEYKQGENVGEEVRETLFLGEGGGASYSYKVPRQCPLVFLIRAE
jgi:hypothetical protein